MSYKPADFVAYIAGREIARLTGPNATANLAIAYATAAQAAILLRQLDKLDLEDDDADLPDGDVVVFQGDQFIAVIMANAGGIGFVYRAEANQLVAS